LLGATAITTTHASCRYHCAPTSVATMIIIIVVVVVVVVIERGFS
jgi:hypothetical protein